MNLSATISKIPGSFITNGDGLLQHMSNNLNEWLGYSPIELIGESFTKIFAKTFEEKLLCGHLNSFISGAEHADEYHLLHKNGHTIPVWINAVSIVNADGNALRFFTLNKMPGNNEPLTAGNQENNLAEAALEFLINYSEECFVMVDNNLTIIRFNKQFYTLYKKYLGKEITIGGCILDYSKDDQKQDLKELYVKALQGETIETELEIPIYNDKPVFFYLKYKPLRDNTGNVIGVFVSGFDITEKKIAQMALLQKQSEQELIYNTVNEIIFLIDVEEGNRFRFQSVNQSFLNSTGLPKEQVLNKYIEDVIPVNSYPVVLENYQKALQTGQPVSWEESSQYPTGEKTGIVTITPILNDKGACLQLLGSVHDITALKISGDKLEKLNAKLKYQAMALAESNLELERFAYVASHDLQEPLRMVSSFLQLLEKKYKDQLDETGSKYIYYAVDGAGRMQKLILDLLEYSRVNTNDDATGDTNMNAVTKEILHIMESKIKELNAIVEVGPLPVLALTRRTQMFQLMQNLISNAFKYHGANQLHISINAIEENNKWIISVKDNGIGFDEAFAEKVFIIFRRLHNKSEYSGTGIGLSICKKIVERYHGKIWAKTAPGKGSCFYFSISK